jgi:hypothetical protein
MHSHSTCYFIHLTIARTYGATAPPKRKQACDAQAPAMTKAEALIPSPFVSASLYHYGSECLLPVVPSSLVNQETCTTYFHSDAGS